MKNYIKYITFALLAAFSTVTVDAKGGSSGGGRGGFSSGSRSSSSSSSRPSTPSTSSGKNGFSSSSNSSKSSSSTPKRSAFDVAAQRKAITPPAPKEKFVENFKAQNAGKYPTTFASQPATRPAYVPQTTTYQGQQRNIEYNQQAGGYGFMNGLGQFMIYDAITDMAFGAHEKEKVVYVEKTKALDAEHAAAVAAEKDEVSGWTIFWFILGGIVLIGGLFLFFSYLDS